MAANKFINLEQIVLDWSWRQYDKTVTSRKQKNLRAKDKKCVGKYIGIKIDWSEVRFIDETKWSRLADEANAESGQKSLASRQQKGDGLPEGDDGPRSNILFQTKFTNNTQDAQNYTMRAEKTTRSSIATCVESGFTRGFEMSVKLASPCQVFEANAGYKREVSLTNIDGETFEEELCWGVESVITVKPEHVAEATLVVDEKRQTGKFVIETRVRGTVYVTFTALRDNNSLVKATANDITDIIREYLEQERRKAGGVALEWVELTPDGAVLIKTHGECKFRYGIRQEVRVDQTPLGAAVN